jgi:hypothetical protein
LFTTPGPLHYLIMPLMVMTVVRCTQMAATGISTTCHICAVGALTCAAASTNCCGCIQWSRSIHSSSLAAIKDAICTNQHCYVREESAPYVSIAVTPELFIEDIAGRETWMQVADRGLLLREHTLFYTLYIHTYASCHASSHCKPFISADPHLRFSVQAVTDRCLLLS